jgi:hypothetical protein
VQVDEMGIAKIFSSPIGDDEKEWMLSKNL